MTTHTSTPAHTPAPADENHMSSVRHMLIEQMRALRSATTKDQLTMETDRAKSVALVAQAITSAAKVEVEYARSQPEKDIKVPFLDTPAVRLSFPAHGTTVHRLLG